MGTTLGQPRPQQGQCEGLVLRLLCEWEVVLDQCMSVSELGWQTKDIFVGGVTVNSDANTTTRYSLKDAGERGNIHNSVDDFS